MSMEIFIIIDQSLLSAFLFLVSLAQLFQYTPGELSDSMIHGTAFASALFLNAGKWLFSCVSVELIGTTFPIRAIILRAGRIER